MGQFMGSSTLDIGTFCRMDIPEIAHNLSMNQLNFGIRDNCFVRC